MRKNIKSWTPPMDGGFTGGSALKERPQCQYDGASGAPLASAIPTPAHTRKMSALFLFKLPEFVYREWVQITPVRRWCINRLCLPVSQLLYAWTFSPELGTAPIFISSKLVGSFAHWMLYGVLIVQVCKSIGQAYIGIWFKLMPTLRLVLYRVPRRSSPCQADCTGCACTRNGPNDHVYTWSVQSSYTRLREPLVYKRGRHRMVLGTISYGNEYV